MRPSVEIASDLGIDFESRLLSFRYEDNDKKKDSVEFVLDNHDLELLAEYPPGATCMVRWGYPGDLTPWHPVQLRHVTGFEEITFEGTSLESVLDRVERTEAYYNASRSAIVRGIAEARYGFSGRLLNVEDTDEVIDTVNQLGETDAAFIKRLAVEEGFVFYVDHTGIHWHATKYDGQPIREITWRRDHPGNVIIGQPRLDFDLLRHFRKTKKKQLDPENKGTFEELLDPENDVTASELGTKSPDDMLWSTKLQVTAEGEKQVSYEFNADPLVAKITEAAAVTNDPGIQSLADVLQSDPKAKDLFSPTLLQQMAVVSEEVLSHGSAKNRKRALAPLKIRLTMTVLGDPSLRAKEVVRVLGIPRVLEGNLYVKRATHEISPSGGYTVELELRKQNLEKNPEGGKLKTTGAQTNTKEAVGDGPPKLYKDTDTGLVYEYPPGFIGPV